jgi:hypothetical protein
MKVIVPGSTPMERLTNFTKRVVAVPKSEVEASNKKFKRRHTKKKRATRP